ncbi:MAG: antibiotic biosynthesis monooxygenase [Steroidobacteraceae bacterium]
MRFRHGLLGTAVCLIGTAIFSLGTALPVTALAQAGATPAGASGTTYVVTYLETLPARSEDAAAVLRKYRQASAASVGNLRSVLLERLDRRGQFVVLTAWQDPSGWTSHLAGERTVALRKQLADLRSAPIDDRVNVSLSMGPMALPRNAGAVFAVTHVDVVPTAKDEAASAMQQLGEAGRKATGNLHFEVTQQASHPNHFSVVEAWASQAALDAHTSSASQVAFRDRLGPMAGALYDERLYKVLD